MPKIRFIRKRSITTGTGEPPGPVYDVGHVLACSDASAGYFVGCGDAVYAEASAKVGPATEMPTTTQTGNGGAAPVASSTSTAGENEGGGKNGSDSTKLSVDQLKALDLTTMDKVALIQLCKEQGISVAENAKKDEVVQAIRQHIDKLSK